MSPFRTKGYEPINPEMDQLIRRNEELLEVVELYVRWYKAVEDPSKTTMQERHDLYIQLRNKAHGTLAKIKEKV